MSNNDSDFGAFLAGFIVGGVVGAAVALLYAPQSGEETRTIIKEKSIELKDKAMESAEEARLRAEKALEDARARAEKALEETKIRADELAQLTRQRAIEIQQRGQDVFADQKTKIESAIETGKKVARRTREKPTSGPSEQAPTGA
jgi:gas vesicle protein